MDGLGSPASTVSPKEEAQVVQFLAQLSELRISDPKQFKEITTSLGIEDSDPNLKNFDLSSITAALHAKRTAEGGRDDSDSGIKIPHSDDKKNVKSIDITPESGFTVKSKRMDDGMKVYINICQHAAIFVPSNKKKLNEEGEEVEGLNIPMSVGLARNETTKDGSPCLVHDIIVNPNVITEARQDLTGKYRDFLCHLAIQCLEQKFAYSLDAKYKLPKLKYKGQVQSQRIQDRKNMPSIVEIDSKTNSTSSSSSSLASKKLNLKAKKEELKELVEERVPTVSFYWTRKVGTDDDQTITEEVETELVYSSEYIEPLMSLDSSILSLNVKIYLPLQEKYRDSYDISKACQLQVSAYTLKVTCIKLSFLIC